MPKCKSGLKNAWLVGKNLCNHLLRMAITHLAVVQIGRVQVIKGQRGQKVQGEPSSQVIDGNLLRIGDNLALARHEGGAEV